MHQKIFADKLPLVKRTLKRSKSGFIRAMCARHQVESTAKMIIQTIVLDSKLVKTHKRKIVLVADTLRVWRILHIKDDADFFPCFIGLKNVLSHQDTDILPIMAEMVPYLDAEHIISNWCRLVTLQKEGKISIPYELTGKLNPLV